ncbi:hypothetical protein MSWH1_0083 [Methanosarcina sp. WH1]|nr:hypothetical protein MSWH1_0083 [Methanosarcina sp. WH1]
MPVKISQKMKRPVFQKKKNSAEEFGSIINKHSNKHSDFFQLLDRPVSILQIVRSFFILLRLAALASARRPGHKI